MRLVALIPIRSEAWICGLSIRAALMWNDNVVALNHASSDKTGEILDEIQQETDKLRVINEPDPTWAEMGHRQRLLAEGRKIGGTHFTLVDADEVLSGNLLNKGTRDQIECLPPGSTLQAPMRNTYGAYDQYREDRSIWGNAITTLAFADAPHLSWKPKDGYEHHCREPHGSRVGWRIYPQQLEGGVMHLQFASRRRLLAKHALYQIDEVLRWPGRRPVSEIKREYGMAPDWTGATIKSAPKSWWKPYEHLMGHLHVDAEPWQEADCRRLVAEHGRDRFAGLDLFGVC